jgi:hypothetical protein
MPAAMQCAVKPRNLPLTERTVVMTDDIRRYSYDVVVIGAGGSGLRAAIEGPVARQEDRGHLQVPVR